MDTLIIMHGQGKLRERSLHPVDCLAQLLDNWKEYAYSQCDRHCACPQAAGSPREPVSPLGHGCLCIGAQ